MLVAPTHKYLVGFAGVGKTFNILAKFATYRDASLYMQALIEDRFKNNYNECCGIVIVPMKIEKGDHEFDADYNMSTGWVAHEDGDLA